MAIIPQLTFFVWDEIEKLGDLERLRLVLEYMPNEELMRTLERERGRGKDVDWGKKNTTELGEMGGCGGRYRDGERAAGCILWV